MTHADNLSNIHCITEGTTQLQVPVQKKNGKGPGKKADYPFYNPAMELNRDLSILITQWLIQHSRKPPDILDGLAATGIRGIRIANEVPGDFTLTINDHNPEAYTLITKNLAIYPHPNVTLTKQHLNTLLSQHSFNYIDIDPFGSPVQFIDAAAQSIKHQGIIACTATDTAALCGVYPNVCQRRYAATPFHGTAMKEVALRILLGFICREVAKYDKSIHPLICHATDHYLRVYVQISKGATATNNTLQHLHTINPQTINAFFKQHKTIGPLWMGHLHDPATVKHLRTKLFNFTLGTKHTLWQLLHLIEEEIHAPCFFYTTEQLASRFHTSPPKLATVFNFLQKHGYIVRKTQFSPTGFKTNAPKKQITTLFSH